MCTVTYIPESEDNFILTSSRDEKQSRPAALPPTFQIVGEKKIAFPKDPHAGGTWIAMDGTKFVCLLNGAFQKHIAAPPYRKSRGQVVLDVFSYSQPEEFFKEYDLSGIEPFTLILHSDNKLHELRWDGQKKYLQHYDPEKSRIWSSVTLYSPEIIEKREAWFSESLQNRKGITLDDIRYFHHFGGENDFENAIKVNRGSLFTVSITSIVKSKSSAEMIYEDLINNEMHKVRI